jgi:hypothetical protein
MFTRQYVHPSANQRMCDIPVFIRKDDLWLSVGNVDRQLPRDMHFAVDVERGLIRSRVRQPERQ